VVTLSASRNNTARHVAVACGPYTACVINSRRISVVLPAYNAEATLSRTVAELDREIIDEVVLVDDASSDQTVSLARELGLEPICHERNKGYGGNQKTCYRQALDLGADVIVMVHPDYQYSPLLVPAMAAMIAYGEYDMVLGSRILAQNSVARGMPRYKYVSNRFLTFVENMALSQKLSEYHTGLRAFSSTLLGSLPFERNSDDFVFDNQIIAQAVSAGARIGEISCPTRYEADSSSINLTRSIRYGLGVLRTCADYRLNRHGLQRCEYLDFEPGQTPVRPPALLPRDDHRTEVGEQLRKLPVGTSARREVATNAEVA
jgi:Glycosyl transferase family 2